MQFDILIAYCCAKESSWQGISFTRRDGFRISLQISVYFVVVVDKSSPNSLVLQIEVYCYLIENHNKSIVSTDYLCLLQLTSLWIIAPHILMMFHTLGYSE